MFKIQNEVRHVYLKVYMGHSINISRSTSLVIILHHSFSKSIMKYLQRKEKIEKVDLPHLVMFIGSVCVFIP